MSKLTIGYDAKRIVSNNTGLGSYARTLVCSLSAVVDSDWSLRLYAPNKGRDELRQQVKETPNMKFVYPLRARTRLACDYWRTRGIVKEMLADGVNVYHGLSGELPMGIRKSGIRSVVTIHDLIFMRHPEYYNPIDVWIYKRKFHATCREADRIIAISECTKRDIVELGRVNPDKIDVIYQSFGSQFLRRVSDNEMQTVHALYNLPPRFVLTVGTVEQRKNALLAVKAMELLPKELSLVIIGRHTPYTKEIIKYVKTHNLSDRVMLLNHVPYEHLPAIYQAAEVFAYPSRYEGFGIPIIEAIQSGLPVVACTGSCLEEAGGPHNIYTDPDDTEAFAKGITSSLQESDGRDERIEQSQEYIRRFEGSDVASQVVEIYKSLTE